MEGQENIQEVLSKRLYVCQCYTALSALRQNGHFVVKMFDLYTPFSVGLLYLMHLCFQQSNILLYVIYFLLFSMCVIVTIIKPNASRPANSERYLVCSKFKSDQLVKVIREYLGLIVHTLWDLQNKNDTELDINEIVPPGIIQEDKNFYDYINDSNNQ